MILKKDEVIKYYSRADIQKEIINCSKDKEVVAKFEDKFGSRPDVLQYPQDITELIKQGATSFHASEELWKNPLQLSPMMKKNEIDELRKGWDLVIDIDSKIWEISKITAWLIVNSLKDFGINSLSVKFSGNKGFHIGVPFEAFFNPSNKEEIANQFPELPRKITTYILSIISSDYISILPGNIIEFGKQIKMPLKNLKESYNKDVTKRVCVKCGRVMGKQKEQVIEFVCPKCEDMQKGSEEFKKCRKCNILMKKINSLSDNCKCGSKNFSTQLDIPSIIEVDTLLVSSRHLYRMPYSLNEKSGLCSMPIDPDKILEFNKDSAEPEKIKVSEFVFLGRDNVKIGEAKKLILLAKDSDLKKDEKTETNKEFETMKFALQEKFFPPCIKLGLKGLKDSRKRFLFILINFLSCVGWDHDKMEEFVKEWNKRNPEQLRETLIVGALRYYKQKKKKVLPPNCKNQMYYKDMQICTPDNLCLKIKNPVNYSKRKTKFLKE